MGAMTGAGRAGAENATAIPKGYWYPTAFSAWGNEEREAINRVIASGRFTIGPEVKAFEAEFAAAHGMEHGVMVNSGSSANLIAVASLFHKKDAPLKRGDKVLVPALAWSTTYAPLVQHGLDITLADCDATWCAEPRLLTGARLIIGCSILGNPAHLEQWRHIAIRSGAYFVEDNCESAFARTTSGKLCGTFGDLNTFSFFYSHQVSAVEGGMILTNDPELADLCRMLRAHGWTRDIKPPRTFADDYDFRLMGYNVRPVEMHAAIARAQLRKQEDFYLKRAANYDLFKVLTAPLPITLQKRNGDQNAFGIAFTVREAATREALALALRAADIDCRLPTGGSVRLHPYGARWGNQQTPVADDIHRCGIFLGNGPIDLTEQITLAAHVMQKVLA